MKSNTYSKILNDFQPANNAKNTTITYSEIIKASSSRELWSISGHYFPDCSDSKRKLR